ncbi:hypothetical protein FWK35_00027856 [Aphis craccivora]|uniref:Uncharacterized protein n=1 Tax=Aphis craccivora TaxID=307492 RepID=A0A6G0Y938_APHCR|nr:hypothetical protein FWK35_00027856 [Aphis craccivora]
MQFLRDTSIMFSRKFSYFSYHMPIITTIPIEQNDSQSLLQ